MLNHHFFHLTSIIESLEERVLFDGAPDAQFIIPSSHALPDVPAQVQMEQVEFSAPRELVLIDANVENGEQLLSSILQSKNESALEIRFLDKNSDGVQQISDILSASKTKYDAIHILSHGEAGNVLLGNSSLNSDSLSNYADQLASWSQAMTDDADLLFYGCNLAGSAQGETFVSQIGAITGADVAASDDLTGHDDLGGDWEFE